MENFWCQIILSKFNFTESTALDIASEVLLLSQNPNWFYEIFDAYSDDSVFNYYAYFKNSRKITYYTNGFKYSPVNKFRNSRRKIKLFVIFTDFFWINPVCTHSKS